MKALVLMEQLLLGVPAQPQLLGRSSAPAQKGECHPRFGMEGRRGLSPWHAALMGNHKPLNMKHLPAVATCRLGHPHHPMHRTAGGAQLPTPEQDSHWCQQQSLAALNQGTPVSSPSPQSRSWHWYYAGQWCSRVAATSLPSPAFRTKPDWYVGSVFLPFPCFRAAPLVLPQGWGAAWGPSQGPHLSSFAVERQHPHFQTALARCSSVASPLKPQWPQGAHWGARAPGWPQLCSDPPKLPAFVSLKLFGGK